MISTISRVLYDPAIHRRDNLLRQIESQLRHPESPLLIGSLGRTAVMGTEEELRARGEQLERDYRGFARDIDLFIPSGRPVSFSSDPFPVDTTALTTHDERLVIDNGSYWLVDDLVGCSVEVDPDVFQPQRARLAGELDVVTFSARTHLALLYVVFDNQWKYATARRVIQHYLLNSVDGSDAELYRPFAEFHRMRRKSLKNHARRLYRRALPIQLRSRLHPIVDKAKVLTGRFSQ